MTDDGGLLAAFGAAARAAGLDPDDRWVGGYVDYEWDHLRGLLEAYGVDLQGQAALEFGCNVGASSVVLARLGAEVTGVEIDPAHVRLASANIALHEVAPLARALHVEDTTALPFADGTFDFALANSVFEYVDPAQIDAVIGEIHRTLRSGGVLLICGTASRLAPREGHSRVWLVNYLPAAADRLLGRKLQRGLSPLRVARALRGRFMAVDTRRWLAARRRLHGRASLPMTLLTGCARALGVAPGWFSPTIELLLRRVP
jgi:SAM-dependent methyltransferase